MATVMMNDSILSSIKMLMPNAGIPADYNVFDTELIGNINAELAVLSQLGVGKVDQIFFISGSGELWSDFIDNPEYLALIPMYIALRVRVIFDPPKSSIVMEAFNKRSDELSFRIQDVSRRCRRKEKEHE